MARDLAVRLTVIIYPPEIIAAGHRGERPVEGKDFQAVTGQIEVADNFRAQQRHHVGTDRKLEPWKDFFGDRRASEHVASFENKNFFPGTGQVGGVDQAVMASADHDDVVFRIIWHESLAFSNFAYLVYS